MKFKIAVTVIYIHWIPVYCIPTCVRRGNISVRISIIPIVISAVEAVLAADRFLSGVVTVPLFAAERFLPLVIRRGVAVGRFPAVAWQSVVLADAPFPDCLQHNRARDANYLYFLIDQRSFGGEAAHCSSTTCIPWCLPV